MIMEPTILPTATDVQTNTRSFRHYMTLTHPVDDHTVCSTLFCDVLDIHPDALFSIDDALHPHKRRLEAEPGGINSCVSYFPWVFHTRTSPVETDADDGAM
jgi:hypothetical protein